MGSDQRQAWQPDSCDIDALLDVVRNRQMVYRYNDDPVPDEDVERILEAARWAPSGHNTQPWEFIVLRDGPARDDVVDTLKRQLEWLATVDEDFPAHARLYLEQAPVLVLLAGDVRYKSYFPDVGTYGVGEAEVTDGIYYESIGCCMQTIHLAAKALGFGTVHLSVRHKFHDDLREAVDLPETLVVHDAVPIGVPAKGSEGQDTGRQPLEELVHWGRFEGEVPSDEEFTASLADRRERIGRMHGASNP